MLPVRDDGDPIYEDFVHTGGDLVGGFIRHVVPNGLRIENDDIGEVPFLQQAAVLDVEACGDRRGHLSQRLFEGGHTLFAHVAAEPAV